MSEFDYNWINFVDDVSRTINTFSEPTLEVDGGEPIKIERSYGVRLKKSSFSSQEFRMYYQEASSFGIGSTKYLSLSRINSVNGVRTGDYKYGSFEKTIDWDSDQYRNYRL